MDFCGVAGTPADSRGWGCVNKSGIVILSSAIALKSHM